MFKIGEIVNCERYFDSKLIGIIVNIPSDNQYGIDFGKGFMGHDLCGALNTETGWYINEKYIDKIKNNNLGDY